MRVGDIEVTAVPDGEAHLPKEYFQNADWERHRELLSADGTIQIPIGCFLVRTGDQTVLVDAGIGPIDNFPFRGGDLPARLAEGGVQPADIDLVVVTHLHFDHIGWLVRDASPFFPNATVRFGAQDIDQFVTPADPGDPTRAVVDTLQAAGRVELIDDDNEIAPGITTLHAPGHTHGHRCVVVSSGDKRAFMLGDAITCPIQLTEPDWEAISDVDPKMAKRTRESLWQELEGTDDVAVAMHFPGLEFGRIMQGAGRRYWS